MENSQVIINIKEVIQIAKTQETLDLEKSIWDNTQREGLFGCFEVTIGFGGRERVDYLTYDSKGIWRCYEIKVTESDFHSKAKKTFVGHYNYYVMPINLYEDVKDEIPNHIGVYCGVYGFVKKPKKQELQVNEQVLKDSMIRSLSRENQKFIKTCDNTYITKLNSKVEYYKREMYREREQKVKYSNAIFRICHEYNLNRDEIDKLIED